MPCSAEACAERPPGAFQRRVLALPAMVAPSFPGAPFGKLRTGAGKFKNHTSRPVHSTGRCRGIGIRARASSSVGAFVPLASSRVDVFRPGFAGHSRPASGGTTEAGQCARYGGRRWPFGSPGGCWPAPRGDPWSDGAAVACALHTPKRLRVGGWDRCTIPPQAGWCMCGAVLADRQGSERPPSPVAERPRSEASNSPWVATGVTERTADDGRARASKPRRTQRQVRR